MSEKVKKTITIKDLFYEMKDFNFDLPVYIQIGNAEPLPIDDVVLSSDGNGTNLKITIEHWTKADDENEPGEII